MKGKKEDCYRQLQNYALEKGAHRALFLPAREIIVEERVRLKCLVPLCPDYNRRMLCPPNLPSVEEFRCCLSLYSWALLLQVIVPLNCHSPGAGKEPLPDEKEGMAEREKAFAGARKLHLLVNQVEAKAFELGMRFAAGFIGGACRLCQDCPGPGFNEPCRHPYRARPSLEGMGVDVVGTLRRAGLTQNFPVKEEVHWTGLVLLE